MDDTPHTACTPESVAGLLTVAVQRPRTLDALAPAGTATPANADAGASFTTATYSRKKHGPRLGLPRGRSKRP